jgi:hypothetical protein
MVIFFHGQGGPEETTPANHRAWIDHLVRRGAVVLYPRYETSYSGAVLDNATTGVRTAMRRLGPQTLPVLALGYSRAPRSRSNTRPPRPASTCRFRTRSRA